MKLGEGSPAHSDLAPASPSVAAIADEFMLLMRSYVRMRQQFLAAAEHDVEWSAHMALRCLANEGPMRSGTLAERLDADPSTVSRQIAVLVRDGLVERRADPIDGRASLLVITEKAHAVLADHDDLRRRHFGRMLETWDERDLATFARLLGRFTEDFVKTRNDWIPTRAGTPAPAEGNV
jgi:DNA-binding MarR family transcriptional regulator